MAAPRWTPEQSDAIAARNGTLLVSAAAGSGKTAVLVQRVLERIIDDGCDADRLLVVTFTKAAAAEMKQRIAQRLTALLEENPDNEQLNRQKLKLEHAHISTVHSFCSDIIRENFHTLDISPTFRIASEDEMVILQLAAAHEVIEEEYENGSNADFIKLADIFSNDRDDDELVNVVHRLYNFIRADAFPELWMANQDAKYKNIESLANTQWGNLIFEEAERVLSLNLMQSVESVRSAEEIEEIWSVWGPILTADKETWERLLEVAKKRNWDELKRAFDALALERWKVKRGWSDHPTVLKAKEQRKEAKERIERMNTLFDSEEKEAIDELNAQYKTVHALFELVLRFSERLEEKKKERNILDFGDLEHLMLKLLYREEDGKMVRSELAEQISLQFDEVMVDEYQDTNGAQDRIFKAISRNENNLFMVGDVKQSIYGFRQADPELFMALQRKQPIYDREKEEYPATVFLRKNFRSRKGVTDGCNFIFRQIMTDATCGITYKDREELVAGAEYPNSDSPDMTLCLLKKEEKEQEEFNDEIIQEDKAADFRTEAMWIAQKIRDMIEAGVTVGTGDKQHLLQYRDCCILLRSASASAQSYAEVLEECGIPAWANIRGGFFGTREISLMLAYLQIIDNPLNDISMLSVLYSPIYGFTPDELAKIRASARSKSLYDAVYRYAEIQRDEKCGRFRKDIERYRSLSVTMNVGRLIRRLIAELRLEAIFLAMRGGDQRVANIRLLIRYAQQYDTAGYCGLSGFLRYIERLKRSREDLNPASVTSEVANVVRVMSIHHSKGLEFPVVFIGNMGHHFNRMSQRGNILLHPRYGVGMCVNGPNGSTYTTIAQKAIRLAIAKNETAEELRVLYVALTRAKEKCFMLYSTADLDKLIDDSMQKLYGMGETLEPIVSEANSMGEWVLLSLLRHRSVKEALGIFTENMETLESSEDVELAVHDKVITCLGKLNETGADVDKEKLTARLKAVSEFSYPLEALTVLPVKSAISALAEEKHQRKYYGMSRPAFEREEGLSAAEKGTVMHKLFQFANVSKARQDLDGEIDRLIGQQYFSPDEVNVIDRKMAKGFFESALADRICKAKRVWREYRFMTEVPATVFDETLTGACAEEKVVLQGIADCVIDEGDGLLLIDYKTDRVNDLKELEQRYGKQLQLYSEALEKCLGKKVKEKLIFSLHRGEEYKISNI